MTYVALEQDNFVDHPFETGRVFLVDSQVAAMVDSAAAQLRGRLVVESLRPLVKPTTEARVADATDAYYIDGITTADDCVLTVSAPGYPDTVDHSAGTALKASAVLGQDLGRAVCVPLVSDRWQGRSFAIYPRLYAFSSNRFVRRAQMYGATPAILQWLGATHSRSRVERTDSAERETRFHAPLQTLAQDGDLSPFVRAVATAALQAVQADKVRTVTCLQHGDFWFGNIMFERNAVAGLAPFLGRFKVIDWGSCKMDGYPGIDAVRFLVSAFGPTAHAARLLDHYGKAAGLTPADLAVGCLCALGRLASELNEFPKRNFVSLVTSVVEFLDRVHALDRLQPRR